MCPYYFCKRGLYWGGGKMVHWGGAILGAEEGSFGPSYIVKKVPVSKSGTSIFKSILVQNICMYK